jgi:hypothetical protein
VRNPTTEFQLGVMGDANGFIDRIQGGRGFRENEALGLMDCWPSVRASPFKGVSQQLGVEAPAVHKRGGGRTEAIPRGQLVGCDAAKEAILSEREHQCSVRMDEDSIEDALQERPVLADIAPEEGLVSEHIVANGVDLRKQQWL